MSKLTGMLIVGAVSVVGIGCDGLSPTTTTLSLVNEANFPVEVTVYTGDEQNTIESVLRAFGDEQTITIAGGSTATIPMACDQLQAVLLDAELMIIGDIGPSQDTDVFRDGTDFGCGDTLSFTFSGLTSLTIAFEQR